MPQGDGRCWSSTKFVKSSQTHYFHVWDVSGSLQNGSIAVFYKGSFLNLVVFVHIKALYLSFLSFHFEHFYENTIHLQLKYVPFY